MIPNRFRTLSFEPEDYDKSFPPLSSSSSKSWRFLSSREQLFIDAAEVNTCLFKMANDLPLDLRSRNFASELVKSFEEHVKEASTDLASRASLEDRVDCLIGLSPIQIAEGLKLNFRPLSNPRAAVSGVSGQRNVIQGEAKSDTKKGIVSSLRGDSEPSEGGVKVIALPSVVHVDDKQGTFSSLKEGSVSEKLKKSEGRVKVSTSSSGEEVESEDGAASNGGSEDLETEAEEDDTDPIVQAPEYKSVTDEGENRVDLCASAAEKQLPGGTLKSGRTKKVLEEEFVEGTKEVVSNEEQGFVGTAPKKAEMLPKANRNTAIGGLVLVFSALLGFVSAR
ncbi:hypothetical protein U1Q18_006452 [Sarracenia purpurea var. burkii]